jgi:membrane-bound lytic murein transglycosylase F
MSRVHFFLLLLAISLAGIIVSCNERNRIRSKKVEEVVSYDLDSIVSRGYITAIMMNNSTSLFLYQAKTMGYEYELLKKFTKDIGVELRIDVTTDIEEGFRKLNSGAGDVLAYNLTVTRDRKKYVAFTDYHRLVRSVLIQRKPDNWRTLKLHEIENGLLRNPIDLIGKEVHVRCNSSYVERLNHLADEIGGDILIIEHDEETEELIKMVAEGSIDFAVAEEDVAYVNAMYYPNIDVETAISFQQQIAWAVRKNAPKLLESMNYWLKKTKRSSDYYAIYDKYFRSTRSALRRTRSDYYAKSTGELSPYDAILKENAKLLNWDWKLLAALIYKESKFDTAAQSGNGALGLMQVLPETAMAYGIEDLFSPEQNIKAGTKHLKWLIDYWDENKVAKEDQVKFVLASYNVGHGHVTDAVKLAEKYHMDATRWDDNVEEFLIKKEEAAYFADPVAKYGYCRGNDVSQYVKTILNVYHNYSTLLPEDAAAEVE